MVLVMIGAPPATFILPLVDWKRLFAHTKLTAIPFFALLGPRGGLFFCI